MYSSPRCEDTTQVWLRGCCPTPILKVPEPEHPITKPKNTSAACRQNFVASTESSLFPNTNFANHESIPTLQDSFREFIKAYPKYSDTARVDQIRAREYSQLSLSNHVCLDYIGVGLFSQCQVMSQYNSIISYPSASPPPPTKSDFALFGITSKSASLKSQLLHGGQGSELESAIKKRIMDFLNISENDYSMVFTANKSAAFRLVAESYPFQTSRKLISVYDHESEAMDAMVTISGKRGARWMAAEFKWPRLRIHSAKLRKMIVRKNNKKKSRGLFTFPLQSRMSGASYSYQWMTMAQEHGWHVLLDACALGPKDMDSFGLSLFRPDFLVCSFYRVFGENPAGFGCLFVKKSVVPVLDNSTCRGIVSITPPRNAPRVPEDSSITDTELEQLAKLEINQEDEITSCSISNPRKSEENESSSIECRCLDHVDSLGLMRISSRGRYLINWLVSALMKLHHPNRLDNSSLVTIYGPKVKFDRGPALAFNIYDWKGEKVEPVLVQKLAYRNNISLGNGVLNHIWFPEKCEVVKRVILEREVEENNGTASNRTDLRIKVVTVALTFVANFEDVYRLWAFVAQFLDADFVEKERWRHAALNEKTIEV